MKWESGLENVTSSLSRAYRTLSSLSAFTIKLFQIRQIEYLTVNDESIMHQFNLSLHVFLSI